MNEIKFDIMESYMINRPRARRKNKKPFLHSKLFAGILIILIIFGIRSAVNSYDKKLTASAELQEQQNAYDELAEKKEHLQSQISALESGRGLEEELRTRFNVTKEGETMIKIVEEE